MNVKSVGKPLIVAQTSCNIRKFTLVRDPFSVRNVEKPSLFWHSLGTKLFILERNHLNVSSVDQHLDFSPNFVNIREFIPQ